MIIGERLRAIREEKKLSQEDVEKRAGLLRCYISRVENGHTVPAIETLETMARALEVPLYQLFYDGNEPPPLPNLRERRLADDIACSRGSPTMRTENACNRWRGNVISKGIYPYEIVRKGGTAMDLQCPACKSPDLKKVSLAYLEGLQRVNTRTGIRGVVVGTDGPDLVVGRAATKGTQQTEISKVLAPPKKWSVGKLFRWSILVFLSVGWLIFYVNTTIRNASSVSSVPLGIYSVLFAVVFVVLFLAYWSHNHTTYPQQYAQWDRSFICQHCGTVSRQKVDGMETVSENPV